MVYCKSYWCLALVRFFLVFIPQTGYIHPDEYFQSIEVLAGHFFDIEVNRPWEYNATFPVRSIGVNYFTTGTSYKLLKTVDIILREFYHKTIFTPYFLVVFPRLLMCMLTFAVDYTLCRLCINNNEKHKSRLLVLASSYVMIVYGTHTFSNTIELVLFSVLLYYVADSMTFSNIIVKQHEYLNKRYEKSKTNAEKAKIHKLRLLLSSHSLRNCIQVSTITVVGFFNRPTFLAFAVCPVFFWLYRGIGFKSVTLLQFHYRMFILLLLSIPTIILFVVLDSFYFGYLSLAEIEFFTVNINNFVFTPLNFLKYNIDVNNLAVHGLHSKYLHILVNLPLLFNVLAVSSFVGVFTLFLRLIKHQYHYLPTIRSIKGLMTTSLITPIIVLSLFPHQEPRFIIPVITPLTYLYSETLLPEPENVIMKTSKDIPKTKTVEEKVNRPKCLFKMWLLINVAMVLFYGFIHQGGIYPAATYLSAELRSKPSNVNFHVVTSHIYSIPESLFLQKSTEKIYHKNNSKYKVGKRIHLFEEGSKDLTEVLSKLELLLKMSKKENDLFYFVFPSSLQAQLKASLDYINSSVQFKDCVNFYPHISTEALPNVHNHFETILNYNNITLSSFVEFFANFRRLCSLQVCKAFLDVKSVQI